jgi:hypothetical protein
VSIPPPILYRLTGSYASLLGWEHREDGWRAVIAWFEIGPDTFAIKRAAVIAEDVRQIPGVDYRAVPKTRAPRTADQRPDDPTVPRSPGRESRAAARARFDRRRPRQEEPDL